MGKLRRSLVAMAVLMFSPITAPAASPSGKPVLLQLEQLVDGDRIYFFRGESLKFVIRALPKRKKYDLETFEQVSNAVVFVERKYPGRIDVLALVDTWIDGSWIEHSVGVLRRQMEFNKELADLRRVQPQQFGLERDWRILRGDIGATLESGILDQRTLLIPYMKLALRYENLQVHFWNECYLVNHKRCDDGPLPNEFLKYWRPSIQSAQQALAALKTRLTSVPLERYAPPVKDDWAEFSKGDPYAGLKDLMSQSGGSNEFSWSNTMDKRSIWMLPKRDEPEKQVQEFVSSKALDGGTLQSLDAAETTAVRAIAEAEKLGNDLFGGRR